MNYFGRRREELKLDIMRTGDSTPHLSKTDIKVDFGAQCTEVSCGRKRTSSSEES